MASEKDAYTLNIMETALNRIKKKVEGKQEMEDGKK